jgi:uncharacterized RDD family membrane protein YckC
MSELDVGEQLSVDSVTGVDVSLPIAGAGGRSYAFVIDWHIRLIVGLGWYLAGTFLWNGDFVLTPIRERGSDSDAMYGWLVVIPAVAIYLLYHPVFEVAMHGRTPGKRMAGVRIVTRTGAVPGIGALLVRNLFRLIDSLPGAYCLGFAMVVLTAQHVRIGDLAAGTLLVYDRRSARADSGVVEGAVPTTLSPQLVELIDDLLLRWKELDGDVRSTLARRLIDRADPNAGYVMEAELESRLRGLLAFNK